MPTGKKMKDKIRLQAEINIKDKTIKVKPETGNAWQDWAFWLEVCGFMAQQARTTKGWDFEQTAQYAKEYIIKCLNDYENQ